MKKDTLLIKVISFLLVIIPLFFVCYFFIYENVNQRREAEIEKNVMIVKSTAMVVEYEINEMVGLMKKTASLPAFKKLDKAGMREIIDLFHSNIYEFHVNDTSGKTILSFYNGQYENSSNTKNGLKFKKVLQGQTLVTGEHKSGLTGEYIIGINVPVFDDSGKVIAVMEAHLQNRYFAKYLDPIKIGKTGKLSLVDGSGYYIYDADIDNRTKLAFSRCYNDGKGKSLSITERISQKTGQKTIYTMVHLKSQDWYMVGSQRSYEVAASGITAFRRNLLTSGLLVMTLFILWRYRIALQYRKLLVERQNAEKLALVGELAAGMAHEIRNPLTAIKGFSDLLKNKEKYKDDKEIFDLLISSVDHIEGIVRETLLLSRPQKMEIGDIDLSVLIRDTCNFMKNEALLKDVNLDCSLEELSLTARGDQLHLKQVLINIIKNSLEATPKGGKVSVKLEKNDATTAKITVTDTGEGIKPEVLDRVGTPFFTTKSNGTGLGLSVCRRVVEEHDGLFRINSIPGRGTTVEIYLHLIEKSAS